MNSFAQINKLISLVLEDRKNANNIPQLLNLLANVESQKQSDAYVENLIKGIRKIFNYYIDSSEMVLLIDTSDNTKKLNSFRTWLVKLYDTFLDLLFKILEDSKERFSASVRKTVLETLFKFVEEEGKFPFRLITTEDYLNFPAHLCERIIESLISVEEFNEELIKEYTHYYQYEDVIHFTMKSILSLIDKHPTYKCSEYAISNIFNFIYPIRLVVPKDLLPESLRSKSSNKLKKANENKNSAVEFRPQIRLCELHKLSSFVNHEKNLPTKKFQFNYVRDAGIYSQLWVTFLQYELPPKVYKRSLFCLDNFAIKHFANPLQLADFLIGSFEMGGIISLCSLSPLYILMEKCNLEYKNFFVQLYKLLEPAVTYVNHRARFLYWCDLFLSSTHISSKIVASFAKKLIRLAIQSPPDTVTILLPFIGNLFIRHPTIQSMLRCNEFNPISDPFLENESNPELTNAINSQMWELKLLESHYEPNIADIAKTIHNDLPKYEWKISNLLETYFDDIIEKPVKFLENVSKLTYDINCDVFYLL